MREEKNLGKKKVSGEFFSMNLCAIISPMSCKGSAKVEVKRKIFDVDVQLVLLH